MAVKPVWDLFPKDPREEVSQKVHGEWAYVLRSVRVVRHLSVESFDVTSNRSTLRRIVRRWTSKNEVPRVKE